MGSLAALTTFLWDAGSGADARVHAIVDGAAHEELVPRLLDSGLSHHCLFKGELPVSLAQASPHLVALTREAEYTRWLLEEGLDQAWGIYLRARVPVSDLLRQLRRCLKVEASDGAEVYFRFYDPRTLRVYLPTCTAEERDYVFGPIDCFFTEGGEDAPGLIRHDWDGARYSRVKRTGA